MTDVEQAKEIHKRVKLFARGTSATNHGEAVVMIDDNILLQKGNFKGLYLVVLDR